MTMDVDVRDLLEQMDISSRWDLLQYIWDDIQKEANKLDWESFYKENHTRPLTKQKPFTCPKCGSSKIEGRSVEANEPHDNPYNVQQAEQKCYCTVCGSEWIDRYTRTEVEIVYEPA
jgi:hypothetical protein